MKSILGYVAAAFLLLSTFIASVAPNASAAPILNDAFARTWARTDKPVADMVVSRTWMWGTEPFTASGPEKYAEASGGLREVQYFDKSRMEINHDPNVAADSPWHVTNGLLVKELMTGQVQVGDNTFEPREPARIGVAGDPDDTSGVTYWYMGLLQGEAALAQGTVVTQILTPGAAGKLYMWNAEFAAYDVTAARYVPDTNHTVASPFWDFMNSWGTIYENGTYHEAALFQDPFYATGFPLTEAYWANVKVAGTIQPVLIQCFQRRCLTYTPNNDPAWRVEAGNVGQHYFRWRYDQPIDPPNPPGQPTTGYEWAATWSGISKPLGIDTDDNGNVYVTSYSQQAGHVLSRYSGSGALQWSVTYDASTSQTDYTDDVSVVGGADDGWVYVLSSASKTVSAYSTTGTYLFGKTWAGCQWSDPYPCNELAMFYPTGIEVDERGGIYLVTGHLQLHLNWVLDIEALYEISGFQAFDVEVDYSSGDLYYTDRGSVPKSIVRLSADGSFVASWDLSGVPAHLAVDTTGNVYVTDMYNHRIQKFSPSGDVVAEWGSHGSSNGQFDLPLGVTVDQLGNVYVTDYRNNRVQKFVPAP